jgi:hypothetical protein
MISTTEELRAASDAFIRAYLSDAGAARAEAGLGGGGGKPLLGGGAKAPPAGCAGRAALPAPVAAPVRAEDGEQGRVQLVVAALPDGDGSEASPGTRSPAAAQPGVPAAPPHAAGLPPLPLLSPVPSGACETVGAGALTPLRGPAPAPVAADKAAAFQAVLDQAAAAAQRGSAARGGRRGSVGFRTPPLGGAVEEGGAALPPRGGLGRRLMSALTCGLAGRPHPLGSAGSGGSEAWGAAGHGSGKLRLPSSSHGPSWFQQFR